jgi:hypothetical protein
MKGKLRLPEGATPMEKLLQLFPLIRMSASSLNSSSKASPTLSGFLTWTMIMSPSLVSYPLKLDAKMEGFWKSLIPSSIHAFCHLNFVEGG